MRKTMQRGRPKAYFDFGEQQGHRLSYILPHNSRIAATTCRFQLRGLNANGNEWGLGVVTTMQTHGEIPEGLGSVGQFAVQRHGDWIETDSHHAADVILGCFGLDMGQVYDHYGRPADGERITLDLPAIVQTLAPQMLAPVAQSA